ncbi:MAG: MarR family transcriptional regulator [Myxococcales bacterium FL481]|nr:MAG: MarR family transcriptional regulator [Myxococcales bacterium FL481]
MTGPGEPQRGCLDAQIAGVRRFNRIYTQHLGLLDRRVLRSDYALLEARLLVELEERPDQTLIDLCHRFGIDRGHASRTLNGLVSRSLLDKREDPEDRRRQRLRLTHAGRTAVRGLHEVANRHVADTLADLNALEREQFISAVTRLGSRLEPRDRPCVRVRERRAGDLGLVLYRHGRLYAEEYGLDLSFEAFVLETMVPFARDPEAVRGRLWVLEHDGVPAGAVALVEASPDCGQLRWLYVEPTARGTGSGQRLVETVIAEARQRGYLRLTLKTASIVKQARALYRKLGFRQTGAEGPGPHWGRPNVIRESWELAL